MEDKTTDDSPSLVIPPFVIVRDACEKDALDDLFPEGVALVISDLRPTGGDYSAQGLEQVVAIERKSLADLLGTLWGKTILADGTAQPNLGRFAYELQKLSRMTLSYVAIEGTRDDLKRRIDLRGRLCKKLGKRQRIDFGRTLALISSLQSEFGVVFCFFRDRAEMAAAIYADLYHSWRRANGLSKSKIGNYQPPARAAKTGKEDENEPKRAAAGGNIVGNSVGGTSTNAPKPPTFQAKKRKSAPLDDPLPF